MRALLHHGCGGRQCRLIPSAPRGRYLSWSLPLRFSHTLRLDTFAFALHLDTFAFALHLDTFAFAPLSILLGPACLRRRAAIDRLFPTSHYVTWRAVKGGARRSLSLQLRMRAVGVSARVPRFPLAIGRPPLARICEGPVHTGCALGLRLGGHSWGV